MGEEAATKIGHVFKGLWNLADDDEETKQHVKNAIANPERYVVKSEREGGGNNLYGEEIKELLTSGEPISQYMLMERIFPPEIDAPMMTRNFEVSEVKAVNELGIFGAFICDTSKSETPLLENKQIGFSLRTKNRDSNEGCMSKGLSVADSPYLQDVKKHEGQDLQLEKLNWTF